MDRLIVPDATFNAINPAFHPINTGESVERITDTDKPIKQH